MKNFKGCIYISLYFIGFKILSSVLSVFLPISAIAVGLSSRSLFTLFYYGINFCFYAAFAIFIGVRGYSLTRNIKSTSFLIFFWNIMLVIFSAYSERNNDSSHFDLSSELFKAVLLSVVSLFALIIKESSVRKNATKIIQNNSSIDEKIIGAPNSDTPDVENKAVETKAVDKREKIKAFLNKGVNPAIITALVVCLLFGMFHFLPKSKYDERFVVGKTVDEIVERYGEYDLIHYLNHDNKDPTNIAHIGYLITAAKPGFMDRDPAKYYFIFFKDGVAVRVRMVNVGEDGWSYA